MDESLEVCVKSLEENENDVRDEARRALLNICHNLLRSPNDDKFRELRLDDDVVIEKLLPAIGALECLFHIGYVEDGERIFLPYNVPLSRLQSLSKLLSAMPENRKPENRPVTSESSFVQPENRPVKSESSFVQPENRPVKSESSFVQPENRRKPVKKSSTEQEEFFDRISKYFHRILHYEDPNLQRKARSIIPITQLEIAAMTKMRELQKSFKLNDTTKEASSLQFEAELIAKDLFLVELLRWFKYECFKWVNSPLCSICSAECVFESVIPSSDPRCSRIELHRCKKCNIIVEFPRYSHPEPLLTLRRGRCGEWANVFTLMCCSLGYDTRFIYDETDHVWTEVWSPSNNRWIHLDPCENVIDKPLMYEKGWKKKFTYIIAFSKDEVQDVTWRYTRDQEAVMKRRKICAEQSLIQLIRSLNEKRQNSAGYSCARREYVIKRNLLELADMLYIPNSQDRDSDETYEGRTSGSLAWRLARGETQAENKEKNYVWDTSKYGQTFELQYNIVKDVYNIMKNDGTILEQRSGWLEGLNTAEGGIFRKTEDDWKMVYLARSPQTERGRVKWTFETKNAELCLETFSLKATSEVFHGATVSWEIEAIFSDAKATVISVPNCNNFHTDKVQKAVRLNVIATLSGGQGQIAWQHAQLFRQSLENAEKLSMIINIQLKNRCT